MNNPIRSKLEDRYTVLLDIGRILSGLLQPEQLYPALYQQVSRVLDAPGFFVARYRLETDTATVVFYVEQGEVTELPLSFRGSDSIAIRERRPVTQGEDDFVPRLLASLPATSPGGAGILAPMVHGEQVIGVLGVTSDRADAYDAGDLDLLRVIADLAAVALSNAQMYEELLQLSLTDPLTELPNRRRMEIFLAKEFAAAQRGRPLAVALFDLDHFKAYNDHAGHQAGDAALRAFGRVLAAETRAVDLAARYGGDEFIVIIAGSDRHGAALQTERVLRATEADPLLAGAGITASVGIATYTAEMASPDELIQAADHTLYRRKAARGSG